LVIAVLYFASLADGVRICHCLVTQIKLDIICPQAETPRQGLIKPGGSAYSAKGKCFDHTPLNSDYVGDSAPKIYV
jgi:hypothetical protein